MEIFDQIKTPEELLEYMNNNIKYGFVGKNGKKYYDMYSEEWNDWYSECFVQTGEEVIKSKIGTCWDQVELERYWFEKNGYITHTYFMWFEINRVTNHPTHSFLIYEKDNKFYYFEHSFESEKGIYEFNSLDEAINSVKERHIKYTKMNYSDSDDCDMNTLVVYEYTKPDGHLGVEEYFDHVTKNMYTKSI